MEKSMKDAVWGDFFEDAPSTSFPGGDDPFAQEWNLSSSNGMISLPPIASPQRNANTQVQPSTPPRGILTPNRRASEHKIARYKAFSDILARLSALEESIQNIEKRLSTITNNHTDLTLWTTRVDRTLASLTRQWADMGEQMGCLVEEEGEWDIAQELEQSALPV